MWQVEKTRRGPGVRDRRGLYREDRDVLRGDHREREDHQRGRITEETSSASGSLRAGSRLARTGLRSSASTSTRPPPRSFLLRAASARRRCWGRGVPRQEREAHRAGFEPKALCSFPDSRRCSRSLKSVELQEKWTKTAEWAKGATQEPTTTSVKTVPVTKTAALDRPHCVPFQSGKCAGTSTASYPQGKKHEIVKCNRPYPPGGLCKFGADCHFDHP